MSKRNFIARPFPSMPINMDLGETNGETEEFYQYTDWVNVACGAHAGDETSMTKCISLAKKHGCGLLAHPSYPDREGFGRNSLVMHPEKLRASLAEQMATLRNLARKQNVDVIGVKPHGALYHDGAQKRLIANLVVDAAYDALGTYSPLLFVAGPQSLFQEACARDNKIVYVIEGFADRRYATPWQLMPRTDPLALISNAEEAAKQASELIAQGRVQTLCIHGDTPNALAMLIAVRRVISEHAQMKVGSRRTKEGE